MITPTTENTAAADQLTVLSFLGATFRNADGLLWLARQAGKGQPWVQVPFRYPDDLDNALGFISLYADTHNIYVCTTLNENRDKRTLDVCHSTTLWADLDVCDPALLKVEPTVLVQTSETHFQAWWYLAESVPPDVAVAASRRIAKIHKLAGCDTDGGLGKMMRLPGTWNLNHGEPYRVRIVGGAP